MTIGVKISLSYNIVLNITDLSWNKLQHEIQYFLDETSLHCINNDKGFHLAGTCKHYDNIQMFWRFPERKKVECIFIQNNINELIEFDFTNDKHMYKW